MFNYIKKIFFLGPEGTYTQIAMEKFVNHFSLNCEFEPISTITKILNFVNTQENCLAVVPIENSVEGIVRETVDNFLILDDSVQMIAQTVIHISHCLISKGNLKDIKTIISHPQALSQCRKFIFENFGTNINIQTANSTSNATKQLMTLDKSYASIANEFCADFYDLNIVETNINDNKDNQTRFALIGKQIKETLPKNRTSVAFLTKNEPGALVGILAIFKRYNLNLVYLESRPSKKVLGEYVFFADIDKSDTEIKEALLEVQANCDFYKLLGSYSVI